MHTHKVLTVLSATLLLAGGCAKKEVSFRQDVHPILQKHCLTCHSAGGEGYAASGFSVETYKSVIQGTKFGRVIVPGSSISSTLVILIEHKADPSINMPRPTLQPLLEHEKYLGGWKVPTLPPEEIKLIRTWIDQGAKDN